MANLLDSPNRWNDGSQSPPAAWDGEVYAHAGNPAVSEQLGWVFNDTVHDGDTVTGTIYFDNANGFGGHLVLVNWNSSEVLGSVELELGQSVGFEFPVDSTMFSPRLIIAQNMSPGTSATSYYGLEFTITPGAEPVVLDSYVIRGTHRAYMGGDSKQAAWIRDEAGRHDLTAYGSLTVEIKRPGRDRPELTLDAEGTADGQLTFTITANGARTRLRPGLFYLYAKGDGKVIYTGLLEMLA